MYVVKRFVCDAFNTVGILQVLKPKIKIYCQNHVSSMTVHTEIVTYALVYK